MEKHDRIFIPSVEVGGLDTVPHERRWRFFIGCKHDGFIGATVHQQTCQHLLPPSCKSARSITPNRRPVNVSIAILKAMGSTEPCQLEIHDDMQLRIVGIGTVGLATLPQPPFSGIKRADDGLVSLVSGCTDRGLSRNF
jgi:hypothetical protein